MCLLQCVDAAQCARRFNTSLASSDYFPDYINLTYDPAAGGHRNRNRSEEVGDVSFRWDKFGWWLCDDSPATNPEFYGYNHVWLPYCSGDLWSGQKLKPTTLPMPTGAGGVDTNVSVYFSGHFILEAALEALDELGLDDAELIVVSGNSAGGIGMWLSIDYINDRYVNPRVVGVSIAGFYAYSFPYTGPGHTDPSNGLADFRASAWPSHVKLWDSYMNKQCVKKNKAEYWACMLANYSYPYVVTPIFIAEALTDQLQLDAHCQLPTPSQWGEEALAYIDAFGQNMTRALVAVPRLSLNVVQQGSHAIFAPACFIHDDFTAAAPLLRAASFKEMILEWLGENATQPHVITMDVCGTMCNPSCAKPNMTRPSDPQRVEKGRGKRVQGRGRRRDRERERGAGRRRRGQSRPRPHAAAGDEERGAWDAMSSIVT